MTDKTEDVELPPVTISFGAAGEAWIATNLPGTVQAAPVRVARYVPESELLTALRESRELREQLALSEHQRVQESGYAQQNRFRVNEAESELASVRKRIAELEGNQ